MVTRSKYKSPGQQQMVKFCGEFEALLVAADRRYAGKIDWDAAHYYFWQGLSADEAAAKYRMSYPPERKDV